jgi:hypothetical protein
LLARHLLHAEHRAALAREHIDHLLHRRRIAVDQVVGKDHRERLVVDHRLRAQHRVPEAELLGLADVDAAHMAREDPLHEGEEVLLPAARELVLDLVGLVEVVLDRPLVPAGDEDHLREAGGDRFLDRVLDERLVDHRHHLFRARLGRRQEAAAEARHREHRFRHRSHRRLIPSAAAADPLRRAP